MPSWLERMCLRTVNRRIAFWALVSLAALLIVGENHRYARNFISGPFVTTADQLDSVLDPDQAEKFYVRLPFSKVIDTGIQEITTTTRNGVKESERISAGYYAVLVGDRFLVVKSSSKPSGTVEGELKALPFNLRNELYSALGADSVQQHVRPLMLDTDGFRNPGYWAIGAAIVLLICLFLFMRPALILRKDISKSPVMQRIRSWGDPISMAAQIEEENQRCVEYKSAGMRITTNFVIENRFFTFNVLRLEDLLWAYKKVTQRSVNFIPTGKSYEAVMVFYGGSATVPGREKEVDEVLGKTAAKAPWAIFGFTKELENIFKTQTDQFCAAVEMRRQELK